ncbi:MULTISPECIES: hypothetical protein [Roseomonadaceae]|uniref:ATP-binding protein n=1 Tax=Falsiroseomonas oleicola TaxID=2801474 RepID=A0ABS6H6J9_9PROT|nr:hypothetical protein [Roseomonas oleicola]MBU8544324.1 hypothetical protein [Roseomonas oleicola]
MSEDDPDDFSIGDPEDSPPDGGGKKPKAKRRRRDISTLVLSEIDLFRGADHKPYAGVRYSRGHVETMLVTGRTFELHLRGVAHDIHGVIISAAALRAALDMAEMRALGSGDVRRVWRRTAEVDGEHWLDMGGGDPKGERRAIRITAAGWAIVPAEDVPVFFIRSDDALPLPEPMPGEAQYGDLRSFINVQGEDDVLLIWAFLVCALRAFLGKGAYPLISVIGEAGGGKSTFCLLLHLLIDPSTVTLIGLSEDVRDYAAILPTRHVVSFDNLSGCSASISDLFSRVATGGVHIARQLNTNGELYTAKLLNPLILNGIADSFGRPDLQERTLVIALERPAERRTDSEVHAEFERLRPALLGLLLDGLSAAIRNLPNTVVEDAPRMADAAHWAEAAAPGLGIEPGRIVAAWRSNRGAMERAALSVDDLARSIITLLDEVERDSGRAEWRGEPAELHRRLSDIAGERVTKSRLWPSNAAGMSNALRRIVGPLRNVHGIEITKGKGGADSTRWVSVRRGP